MSLAKVAIVASLGLALVACEGVGQKQGVGTVLGGVGGAVAGAQFGKGKGQLASTAAGALLGALLGGEVGKSLDQADRLTMERTTNQALESGRIGAASEWRNPDSGNSGTITPTRTYQKAGGEYCREFTQTVSVGGKSEQAFGMACRQPDGTWKIVSG
ncbi:MAG: glycine zipper 2TM domain-containing protein [Alphaproteobacteria bacterium]|nr:glycine zipper 2TM domain-containing protein [Alphaproteobacteria bacterium]